MTKSLRVLLAFGLCLLVATSIAMQCKGLDDPRWTTEAQLRETLAKLKERCKPNCETYGLFAPDSISWEVNKVPYRIFFAEMELYMQLAHPIGAQGVFDYSPSLKNDPIARFRRTFDKLWKMNYGPFSQVEELALKVFQMHSNFTGKLDDAGGIYEAGDPYSVADPDALLWVHVIDTYAKINTYELYVRTLTAAEKDRYFAESKLTGMLFGIPEERIPETWARAEQYIRHMVESGQLEYTPTALKFEQLIKDFAAKAERKNPLLKILRKSTDMVTAANMPKFFGGPFKIKGNVFDRAAYQASIVASRQAYKRLPEFFKTLPLYRIAQDRLKGNKPNAADVLYHLYIVGQVGPKDIFNYYVLGEKKLSDDAAKKFLSFYPSDSGLPSVGAGFKPRAEE